MEAKKLTQKDIWAQELAREYGVEVEWNPLNQKYAGTWGYAKTRIEAREYLKHLWEEGKI